VLTSFKLLGEVDYTSVVSGRRVFHVVLRKALRATRYRWYEEVEEILTPQAANADVSRIDAETDEDGKIS